MFSSLGYLLFFVYENLQLFHLFNMGFLVDFDTTFGQNFNFIIFKILIGGSYPDAWSPFKTRFKQTLGFSTRHLSFEIVMTFSKCSLLRKNFKFWLFDFLNIWTSKAFCTWLKIPNHNGFYHFYLLILKILYHKI